MYKIKAKFNVIFKSNDIINNIKIKKFYRRAEGINIYICECLLCNNKFFCRENDIVNQIVTSCGCDKNITLKDNLEGKRFGMLNVIKLSHINKFGTSYYLCKCKCGNFSIIRRDALIKNRTSSCGCLSQKLRIERTYKHGLSNTRFYRIWTHIIDRCTNKNNNEYPLYGGRGITYDSKWNNFEGFYEDMYESYCKHVEEYGEKNTTIDRTNVDGNYCKENCTWATLIEQANNRSTNINIYIHNKKYTLMQAFYKFADKSLIYESVLERIKAGSDPIMSLLLPINKYNVTQANRKEAIKDLNIPIFYCSPSVSISYGKILNELNKLNDISEAQVVFNNNRQNTKLFKSNDKIKLNFLKTNKNTINIE